MVLTLKKDTISISVTGHRPSKLIGGYDLNSEGNLKIKEIMILLIEKILETRADNVVCYSGMALGIDSIFADAVLTVKNKYPENIKLICAIPFENQSIKWVPESVDFYNAVLDFADEVINTSGEKNYEPKYMQIRNMYMVDNSDIVIAFWDGSSGGTANCVKYAQKKGKPIVFRKEGLLPY